MKKIKATVFGLIAFTMSAVASAENAAPFGFELGVATLAEVKSDMKDSRNEGTNPYSHGPMLRASGGGVDGVQDVLFIFNPDQVLAGVVVTMNKDPVSTMKSLQKKYKMTSNRVDSFMNKGNADFVKGDSVIKLEAPHLSFTQTVTYLTNNLWASYTSSVRDDAAQRQRRKDSAL